MSTHNKRAAPAAGDRGAPAAQEARCGAASRLSGMLPLLGVSCGSGALLYLAFPPADLWPLSYVALAPLFLAAHRAASWKGAAGCGLAAGLVAYLPGLFWLSSVTVGGWIGLAFYVSAYLAAAAVLARLLRARFPRAWPLLAATGWVGLELMRARFATGFPYLLYGYSQHRFGVLIQLSALTGVYGVSFLLVLFNAALASAALGLAGRRAGGRPAPAGRLLRLPLVVALLICVCALVGSAAVRRLPVRTGPVVGVVQQNIPRLVSELVPPPEVIEAIEQLRELREWLGPVRYAETAPTTEAYRRLQAYDEEVYARIRREIESVAELSETLEGQGVHLLVWPETTVGVPLNIAPELNPDPRSREIQLFALQTIRRLGQSMGCHLLVGAPSRGALSEGYLEQPRYATTAQGGGNSAILFTPEGEFAGRYDKMHLVPFGEYIPLRKELPFLQKLTPMTRELTPGTEGVIFELPLASSETVRFGVLICYEDVVPSLVREFRQKGAQMLVNITDEGWYLPAGELEQHLAMAVFRAVETRTTLVRAANTGISCFIGPSGDVYATLRKEVDGRLRARNVKGALSTPVRLCDAVTPYVRFGDVFAWACVLLTVAVPLASRLLSHRSVRPEPS